jgi:hypothetical protein
VRADLEAQLRAAAATTDELRKKVSELEKSNDAGKTTALKAALTGTLSKAEAESSEVSEFLRKALQALST